MADSDLQITFGADTSAVTQGVGQVQTALGGVAPGVDQLGKSFGDLASKVRGGFEGLNAALAGIRAAGAAGVEGLAGLAEAGGGATAAIAAVAGIAISAAGAIAQWADRTASSSAASASARQNATALESAMQQAGAAFGQVGDTLASAFAPALTTIVGGLTGMAKAFEDSYTSGGLAKTVVDGLVEGLNYLVGAATASVAVWKAQWDVIADASKTWSDAFGLITTLVGNLRNLLTNQFAPAFKSFQGAAQAAWDGVKGGFDGLLKALAKGYDGWKALNQPLIGSINALGVAFRSVETIVQDVLQRILGWIGQLSSAVLRFIDNLPGVSTAAKRVNDDLRRYGRDVSGDIGMYVGGVSHAFGQPTPTPSQPAPTPRTSAQHGQQPTADGRLGTDEPADQPRPADQHGCDPGAAIACAQQAEAGKTDVAAQALSDRTAINAQANATIADNDNRVDQSYQSGQTAQNNAAIASSQLKVKLSKQTAAQLADDQKRYLKTFESDMDGVVSTFSNGLLQMAEGTKSLGQVMRLVGQQIVKDMIKAVDQMVDTWAHGIAKQVASTIMGENSKNAAQAAGAAKGASIDAEANMKAVIGDAATAASGAYKALSGVPIIGPELGAAAAATVFAAVMAFRGMIASAAGGFDIPRGLDPVTQLHAQEMVLPARLANPLRSMLSDYADRGAAAAGPWSDATSGDTYHLHLNMGAGADGASLQKWFNDHGDKIVKSLKAQTRRGAVFT